MSAFLIPLYLSNIVTASISSLHASDDDYDDRQGMITVYDDRSDGTLSDGEEPTSDGNTDPQ